MLQDLVLLGSLVRPNPRGIYETGAFLSVRFLCVHVFVECVGVDPMNTCIFAV